jgi:hypothetical protein
MALRLTWMWLGLLLFVGALVAVGARPAHACSCVVTTVLHDFRAADAVFTGTTGPLVDGLAVTRRVDVHDVYKGSPADVITLNSGQEGPNGAGNSCNIDLPEGQELVFFAAGAGSSWGIDACSYPRDPNAALATRLEALAGHPGRAPEGGVPALDGAVDDPVDRRVLWASVPVAVFGAALLTLVVTRRAINDTGETIR